MTLLDTTGRGDEAAGDALLEHACPGLASLIGGAALELGHTKSERVYLHPYDSGCLFGRGAPMGVTPIEDVLHRPHLRLGPAPTPNVTAMLLAVGRVIGGPVRTVVLIGDTEALRADLYAQLESLAPTVDANQADEPLDNLIQARNVLLVEGARMHGPHKIRALVLGHDCNHSSRAALISADTSISGSGPRIEVPPRKATRLMQISTGPPRRFPD